MKKRIKKLIKQRKGATAIEYALIIALISIICLVSFKQLGYNIKQQVNKISTEVFSQANSSEPNPSGPGKPS